MKLRRYIVRERTGTSPFGGAWAASCRNGIHVLSCWKPPLKSLRIMPKSNARHKNPLHITFMQRNRKRRNEMKEIPKVGDRVEFKYRGIFTGKVIAVVVETGVHFLIESPVGHKPPYRRVGLSKIIRILPGDG